MGRDLVVIFNESRDERQDRSRGVESVEAVVRLGSCLHQPEDAKLDDGGCRGLIMVEHSLCQSDQGGVTSQIVEAGECLLEGRHRLLQVRIFLQHELG